MVCWIFGLHFSIPWLQFLVNFNAMFCKCVSSMIINSVIAFSTSANKGLSFPHGYNTVVVASTTCFLIRSINSGRQDIYFAFLNLYAPWWLPVVKCLPLTVFFFFFFPSGSLNGVMNFKLHVWEWFIQHQLTTEIMIYKRWKNEVLKRVRENIITLYNFSKIFFNT